MSPEQAQGKTVDHRADIWSFGIVLHEMITGTLPFDASYEYGLLYSIIHDQPSSLSQRQPPVHPEYQSIIDKCLEKDPQRRYGTAAQMVDHILSVGSLPPPTSSITAMKRIVHRGVRFVRFRWGMASLMACLAITGVLLVLILRSEEIQSDVIVYEINYVSATDGPPGVTKGVLEYLLRDVLEQSSYRKILTRGQFSRTYPGKIPAAEVTLNVQAQSLNTEIRLEVRQANNSPLSRDATYDKTYQFSDPSMLLKGVTDSIADNVLRVAGIAQKKASSFTPSWDAFESFYDGEKAWQKRNVTEARQAFQQALRIDSTFVLARLRFADALRFESANAEAQTNVQMIESHLGKLGLVDSLKARALIALLRGDMREYVALLREVLDHKPWAVESPFDLAEGYYRLCDIKKAKEHYLKALDIDSNFALAHNHLGYCYTHMGEHERALEHFRKYIHLDSTANSYDSYGDGLFSAGFLDSAAWAKERGLSLDPKFSILYQSLFFIRLFQGQVTKAEECIASFRRNAFTNDLRARAEFFDAVLDYFQNRNGEALQHCLHAQRIFDSKNVVTRNHDLHWLFGLIYVRLGRQDFARQELREMGELITANRIDATNYRRALFKSTLHLRACLAAKAGDFQTVNKFAEELDGPIKTKVKDGLSAFDLSFFYTALGELYLDASINRPEYAEEYFKKSLIYNPRFPFAHHQLWLLYQRTNRSHKATEHLRALKGIWRDADPAWKAIYFARQSNKETGY